MKKLLSVVAMIGSLSLFHCVENQQVVTPTKTTQQSPVQTEEPKKAECQGDSDCSGLNKVCKAGSCRYASSTCQSSCSSSSDCSKYDTDDIKHECVKFTDDSCSYRLCQGK